MADEAAINVSACSGEDCGAPIFWAYSKAKGVAQPVDFEPNPNGNLRLTGQFHIRNGRKVPEVEVVKTGTDGQLDLLAPEEPRFMPHHATCPNAEDFRRAAAERHRR